MRLFSTILMLLVCTYLFSQEEPGFGANFVPLSPEAANIFRYNEIPVDHSTGVPNISIPIYTIKEGGLELPISISYHASGIKVEDVSGPVGLGWVLNAGGSIGHQILGQNDLLLDRHLRIPYENAEEIDDEISNYDLPLTTLSNDILEDLVALTEGRKEKSSDRFQYSFGGKSGIFRFDYLAENIITIPYTPIEIKKRTSLNDYYHEGFEIIDENGIEYEFAKSELVIPYSESPAYKSMWLLTKMTSADLKQEIFFNYDTIEEYENRTVSQQYVRKMEYEIDCDHGSCWLKEVQPLYTETETYPTTSKYKTPLLTSIVSNSTIIELEYATKERLDIRKKRLEKVTIKSKKTNETIKVVDFDNDHYFRSAAQGTARLKLESLSITNTGVTNPEIYEFSYNGMGLPKYLYNEYHIYSDYSYQNDYWGYYRGYKILNSTSVPGEFMPEEEGTFRKGDRNPDEYYMKACIIEKITYPTGGHTLFEFEANRAEEAYSYDSEKEIIGGLRVAKISHFEDPDSDIATEVKTYKYGLSEDGYAAYHTIITPELFTTSKMKFKIYRAPGTLLTQYKFYPIRYVYNNPLWPLTIGGASPAIYDCVTEYIGEPDNNVGKTVYHFKEPLCLYQSKMIAREDDDSYDDDYYILYHSAYQLDKGNYIPTLDFIEVFDNNNTEPIKQTKFKYNTFKQLEYHTGINVYAKSIDKLYPVTSNIAPHQYAYHVEDFEYSDMYAYSDIRLLTEKEEIIDGISTKTVLNYDNDYHLLPTRIETTTSENETQTTYYHYPPDYPTATNFISDMNQANIINRPIETLVKKNDKYISGKHVTYRTGTNLGLPDKVYSLRAEEDWTGFEPSNSGGDYNFRSAYFDLEVSYDQYDDYGNPLQITTRNGNTTSYIWGYNNTLPVVKAVNASSTEFFVDIFEDNNIAPWTISNANGSGTDFSIYNDKMCLINYASASSGECDRICYNNGSEMKEEVVLEFDVTIANSNSWDLTIAMGGESWTTGNGGTENAVWTAINNETWYFYYPNSWIVIKSGLQVGNTYHFKIVANCSSNKADFYVNDEKCYTDGNFRYSSTGIQKIAFGNYGYGSVTTTWYIDNVRLYRAEAVTTYTYKPLVGMTSKTDMNGKTTYYEYDGLGRLERILDYQRNILEEYEYNYINQ